MASFLLTLLLAVAIPLAFQFWKLFIHLCWKPRRINKILSAQGIRGPPFRFFYGNLPEFLAMGEQARSCPMPRLSHDIVSRVLPHYDTWSKEYGRPFMYWFGYNLRFNISNPEMVKEIVYSRSGHFPKQPASPAIQDLLGNGLGRLEGKKWAHHRRIVNPSFFMEKLKAMTPTIAACATTMLEKWQSQPEEDGGKVVDVHKEFRTLTADVIAHTAFGSSFAEGKEVFELQHEQLLLLDKRDRIPYIPGFRFLPTATNRYRWRLKNRIQKSLRHIIQNRIEASKMGRADLYGNDLLALMMGENGKELHGNQKNLSLGMQDIMDECKTFFFAGHETTSTLLTWTLMLLSSSWEWQERARAEVVAVCGRLNPPDEDALPHLKIVGMVLNEALRLYPPIAAIFRKTVMDMNLSNNLVIPEGVSVVVAILAMHHDAELWGEDVNEFNPDRFADGVVNACKHPMAFLPFSVGPRNCVGQHFAMVEAKVVLSMILQRFTFHLSTTYEHAPVLRGTLQPEQGMPIRFERLRDG